MLEGGKSARGLRLPSGGIEDPLVLRYLRELTQRLRDAGHSGTWMFVDDGEVVGLGGYKRLPKDSTVEIGYGVAASRRGLGHATRAVGAMIATAGARDFKALLAETAIENLASQRVLERNGFERTGTRMDVEDGEVVTWRRAIS
jgi:RimJ/RimL family protein N-acetyltransferase